MNIKTTIGVVAALIVATAAVFWANYSKDEPKQDADARQPKALFNPPLGELAAFEIKAENQEACSFAMEEGKWVMVKPLAGPTQTFNVDADARKIRDLKYVRAYPKGDPDRPDDRLTSLSAPPRIARLTDQAGKKAVVKIGATQQLSSKTYVQLEGDETIYVVDEDLNQSLRRKLKDYRGTRLLEFAQSDAVRIELSGLQTYTLAKGADGKWTIEQPFKARADLSKVNAMLTSLSSLTAQSFVEDGAKNLRPYGLEPPRLAVAVTIEKKTPKPPPPPPAVAPAEPEFEVQTVTYHVALGAETDDGAFGRMVTDAAPSVFQVSKHVVTQLSPSIADIRDKRVTLADTTKAQKLTVTTAGVTTEIDRQTGRWLFTRPPPGVQLVETEYAAIDDLLKAIRDLNATGFETGAIGDFGFSPPVTRIELVVEGMVEPVELLVGRKTPSGTGVYVKNVREDLIAVVPTDRAESLSVHPIAFLPREVVRYAKNDAQRIELERGDRGCTLVKEGSNWSFSSPIQADADDAAVNNILTDTSFLRGRKVVGLAADAATFGLDRPEIRAIVTVQAPPPPRPASQPTSDAASQPAEPEPAAPPPVAHALLVSRHTDSKVYAMKSDGAVICEIDEKIFENLDAELLDTKVLAVDPSTVVALRVAGAATYELEKSGDRWTLAGEPSFTGDDAKVRAVAEALRDLRAKRFVRYGGADLAAYGLNAPETAIAIRSDDGRMHELRVSATGIGGDRYACTADGDRVFLLPATELPKFVKPVQEFRKPG